MLVLHEHFIFSISVESGEQAECDKGDCLWPAFLDTVPGCANMETGPMCLKDASHPAKSWPQRLLRGLDSWAAQRSNRRAPPPELEKSRFFSKESFLLGLSGSLLICSPTEWVKNVYWSHTNMWSLEHWWHSTTKGDQGGREESQSDLGDKRDFLSKARISCKGLTQRGNCDGLTFCRWVAAQVFGEAEGNPTLLETPKSSQKMPAFI